MTPSNILLEEKSAYPTLILRAKFQRTTFTDASRAWRFRVRRASVFRVSAQRERGRRLCVSLAENARARSSRWRSSPASCPSAQRQRRRSAVAQRAIASTTRKGPPLNRTRARKPDRQWSNRFSGHFQYGDTITVTFTPERQADTSANAQTPGRRYRHPQLYAC